MSDPKYLLNKYHTLNIRDSNLFYIATVFINIKLNEAKPFKYSIK